MSEHIELTITDLNSDGDGVGRGPDGIAVFVPFSAPGDRLSVEIVERKKRFARGETTAILQAGAGRIEPECAVFGKCGGCTWQHLDYGVQVAAKQKILTDALTRVGKLELPGEVHIVPSPQAYGYRSRARLRVQDGALGYLGRGSHDFCAVESCPILTPALQAKWTALAAEHPQPDGEWELAAGTAAERADDVRATPLGAHSRPAKGSGTPIVLHAGAHAIEISPGGFAQANPLLFDVLTAAVWSAAGRGKRLLELFCGSGFFTLELARRFDEVIAVEMSVDAVQDLRRNIEAAGIENIGALTGRVEDVCCGRALEDFEPDVVLLDPPRVGLAPAALEAMRRIAPRRIVYVSCNPATLARDSRGLCEDGYRLVHIEGFDLFPQTPHVEALAVLELEQ